MPLHIGLCSEFTIQNYTDQNSHVLYRRYKMFSFTIEKLFILQSNQLSKNYDCVNTKLINQRQLLPYGSLTISTLIDMNEMNDII